MRIKFIYPDRYADLKKFQLSLLRIPPLNLLTLAGLTPNDTKIEIVDERYHRIKFDDAVDLVAITALTCNAPRAYEIADEYRRQGKRVILGGIHPTFMYEEASLHADSVVLGEAEGIWEEVIDDFRKGTLKPVYAAPCPDLSKTPLPRWDLLPERNRYVTFVQTSRGCPNDCAFCSVTTFSGRKVRVRPIESVIKEIKSLGSSALKKFIIFVDDNILGNVKYAKKLFKSLIPLKIRWGSETSINLLKDMELLKLAVKSGCRALFIGFETLSEKALKQINKSFNRVKEYKEVIKTLHRYGIAVIASLIFGFDDDDKGVFKRTVDFLEEAKVDAAIFSILTPLPGTRLYKEFKAKRRIFERNWSKFDALHATFYPKKMTPKELEAGLDWSYREFYRPRRVLSRIFRIAKTCPFMIPVNFGYMVGVRRGLVADRNNKNNLKQLSTNEDGLPQLLQKQ
ncbi:MAG TPA: B12-binding domain-containing radical SAM protein [bacterium (Candidatus Stahlbacteria)]|nr:B12-binding domain-containing radical SAM protein [Candidatus Stahlbacteria bacterium]